MTLGHVLPVVSGDQSLIIGSFPQSSFNPIHYGWSCVDVDLKGQKDVTLRSAKSKRLEIRLASFLSNSAALHVESRLVSSILFHVWLVAQGRHMSWVAVWCQPHKVRAACLRAFQRTQGAPFWKVRLTETLKTISMQKPQYQCFV